MFLIYQFSYFRLLIYVVISCLTWKHLLFQFKIKRKISNILNPYMTFFFSILHLGNTYHDWRHWQTKGSEFSSPWRPQITFLFRGTSRESCPPAGSSGGHQNRSEARMPGTERGRTHSGECKSNHSEVSTSNHRGESIQLIQIRLLQTIWASLIHFIQMSLSQLVYLHALSLIRRY